MEMSSYRSDGLLQDMFDHMARMLGRDPFATAPDASTVETSDWVPAVDIRETPDAFHVEADIPGVDPKAIEITLEDSVLTIRGERRRERSTDEHGTGRIERRWGSFYRRFVLPESADPDAVRARSRHGVLRIEIGKREAARIRRIPVKT